MNRLFTMVSTVIVATACAGAAFAGWPGDPAKCPPDSKKVGATCVDKYEASVWQIPAGILAAKAGKSLIAKIQKGKATLTDLTTAGATPLGCFSGGGQTAYPGSFPSDGNWTAVAGTDPPTPGIYAVSIAGVLPSTCISWFQAAQACALSNKYLPSNQQWQIGATPTNDPGANDGTTNTKCNTTAPGPRNTGLAGTTRGDVSTCVSNWGVEDTVGNVGEWVADWADLNNVGCTDWTSQTGIAGGDDSCFGGDGSSAGARIPGALFRGGTWGGGTSAGVFAVDADLAPSSSFFALGFRCAR